MANTYSITPEGSEERLHKQVALQEWCTTVKNISSQHYKKKKPKQIRDVHDSLINEASATSKKKIYL